MSLFTPSGAGASRVAGEIDSVFIFITLVGLFFFLLTQGFLIYYAIKYRRKKREEEEETPYITGNRVLEWVWIVIPTILVMVIFAYGYKVYRDIRISPPGAQEINVTAKQWFFEFKYPDGRSAINEVRVPMGKPVKFIMTSRDVIHSFYLPDFRIKQDVLPGAYTYLWLQPEKTGSFDIFCAEYCGVGHSVMRAKLVVMGQQEYDAWAGGAVAAAPGAVPTVARGKKLVEDSGCLACHSLDGTAKIGPTLKGIFGRTVELADGKKVNADDNYLRESLIEPNARLVKGFQAVMPTFKQTLKEEDIAAIIAYLKTVK